MVERYYLDTCIWRDHYEARYSFGGKPLGDYASAFFAKAIQHKDIILFSDLTIHEMKEGFEEEEIHQMMNLLFISGTLKKVSIDAEDYKRAQKISIERGLPTGDVLHAIIAAKNNAFLVSQDNHFQALKDIVHVKKAEHII